MGGPGAAVSEGAGTQWLTVDAPIVPGETIELELITWDTGDHLGDMLVLVDHFRWNAPKGPVPH
jgi:hypothetical protein